MVSDGSCGHRPIIWRPSDMVSVVDRPIDELIVVCCARKSAVPVINYFDALSLF
jgi:hypothetical protein